MNAMADHLASIATHASIHTAAPNSSGSNESTAARQPIVWGAAASGDISITGSEAFTGGAASGPATHVGLWTAITGGTFLGGFALTGDQAFNAAGEYTLTDVSLDGDPT
jgi:hypothetical protein